MSTDTYQGDIFYETLKEHLADNPLVTKLTATALELGFEPYKENPEDPLWSRLRHYDRLFHLVVTTRIEKLADFDEILKDEPSHRTFLDKLLKHCLKRGVTLVAVPEDIIAFIIMNSQKDLVTKDYLRTVLAFKPQINEALIDILGLP